MNILLPVLLFLAIILSLLMLIFLFSRVLLPKGPLNLTINKGEPLQVAPGQTLLNALYASQIYIPSACGGKGTCGYCKVRLEEGGEPLPTEIEFLTRKERKEGVRLACQVKLMESLEVHIPEEYLNAKEFTSKVTSTARLTGDINEITFTLPEGEQIAFTCGQYIQVKIPHAESPEGFVFRAYSIASPEYETSSVTLNVKRIEGGIGSTWLHNLTKGDEVVFTGPYGEWSLDQSPEAPLVLIGGGVGMAPMRSIILSAVRSLPHKEIQLYFGARTQKDLLYHEVFTALAQSHPSFHYIPALSDLSPDDSDWPGERGFIHLAFEKEFKGEGSDAQAFLCGPPLMINAALESLEVKEVPKKRIFFDDFGI